MLSTDLRVVKSVNIAAASSGNNTIVAAVTDKRILVVQGIVIAGGIVNSKFQSGASGTDITGLFYHVTGSGFSMPYSEIGWFRTGVGELLNLSLSGAIAVGGVLYYIEIE